MLTFCHGYMKPKNNQNFNRPPLTDQNYHKYRKNQSIYNYKRIGKAILIYFIMAVGKPKNNQNSNRPP